MKLLVIYNRYSNKKISDKKFEYLKKELKDIYDEIEIPLIDKTKTTDYISIPADTILIIGGDGTAHDIISKLLENNLKRNICFIPAGTCNDYARNFGYKSFKKAIKIIKQNHIIKHDAYKINDNYFVYGIASGGISMISYDVDETKKRKEGKLAYYLRIIKYIFKTPANARYEISYDGNTITDNFYLVLGVDNRYLGGFKLNKKFRNNFKLILFKKRNRLKGFISFTSFIIFGRLPKKDFIVPSDNFKIKTDAYINLDGELYESQEVEVSRCKDALNIISDIKRK